MLAYEAVVMAGRTIRLHLGNTDGYNADFDGDEMNLSLPIDEMSKAEAFVLLNSQNHIMSSQSGRPINGNKLNTILGAYYMTRRARRYSQEQAQQLITTFLGEDGLKNEEEQEHWPQFKSKETIHQKLQELAEKDNNVPEKTGFLFTTHDCAC
jgi:DNA-directed RNA polymerase I subunit RPA1